MSRWVFNDVMYRKGFVLTGLLSLFVFSPLLSQLPETDIWLVTLETKNHQFTYSNPVNITNRKGYDNQPSFTPDGKSILFTSIREGSQADIYAYDIASKKTKKVTSTQESEYSPTITPDEMYYSTVVVEKDSSQVVYKFGIKDNAVCHRVSATDSIGYHSWLNADTLLYYKLTEPHSLRALDLTTGKDVWICDHPSRAFKRTGKGSQFIYAIKDSLSLQFRLYNPLLRESLVYATSPSGNEDFIWHPELGLIKSENADLMRYNELSKSWEVLVSFSSLGIKKITRFVIDKKTKQLAIVSNL